MAVARRSDLLFLLQNEGVPADAQEKLRAAVYVTGDRFAMIADTRAQARLELEAIGIDVSIQRAMLVGCWGIAKERFQYVAKTRAEAGAVGLPRHR